MIDLQGLRTYMARVDSGYGVLLLTALLIVLGIGFLWRWKTVRPFIQLATASVYTLSLLAINPALAVTSSLTMLGVASAPSITLPRFRLPLWFWPLLLALVLRIPRLFDNLWYDETFTARMASIPLENLPVAIMGDVHPPLNYLIQWLTARLLGTSEVALRLPSLVFGLLLVLVTCRMAHSLLLGRKVAFVAAMVVAIMPAAIYYSNEARQYMLLALLVISTLTALLEGRRWRFALLCALIPWTHNIGFVYAGVLCAVNLWRCILPRKFLYVPLLIVAVSASVWLPFMLKQSSDVANGFWLQPLTLAGVFWPLTDTTISLKTQDAYILHTYVPAIAFTIAAFYAYRHWLRGRDGLLLLAIIVGVPALVALVSIAWRPVYLTRALLPCGLLLSLLWARLLIDSRLARLVYAPALLIALLGFYSTPRAPLGTYFGNCAGVDAIYSTSTAGAFMATYYLPNLPHYLWTGSDDLNQSLPDSAKAAFQFQQADAPPHGSVCVFQVDNPTSTPEQRSYVAGLLEQHSHTTEFIEVNYLYHFYFHTMEVE